MRELLRYIAVILTIFTGLIYTCIAVARNGLGFHVPGFDNLEFDDDYLIKEHQFITKAVGCSFFCAETLTCMSFFFHEIKQKCRLHGTAVFDKTNGLEFEGWKYYVYGEKCPTHLGFVHDRENNFCIRISEMQLKADEGKQFCTNLTSNLISLETADKQTRFDNFLAKIPNSFIIGRIRIGLEKVDGEWKWQSGALLEKHRWLPKKPNCGTNCNCGAVTANKKGMGWGDNKFHGCKNRKGQSICEIL